MTTTLKLPSLGESVDSGRVLAVLVAEGDVVGVEDSILEIETDKATVEVPAQRAGKIDRILVSEGDEIKTGHDLLELEEHDETDDDESKADVSEGGSQEPADEQTDEEQQEPQGTTDVPDDEEADDDGDAQQTDDGEDADEDDEQEAAEERAGSQQPDASAAERRRRRASDAAQRDDAGPRMTSGAPPAGPRSGRPSAPPRVRRLARQLGVDLSRVAAANAEQITDEDLHSHVRAALARASPSDTDGTPELPDFSSWGDVTRESVSTIRRATARTVIDSWRIPQVTHFDAARVDALEGFRTRHGEGGQHLSLTAILVKILGEALLRFPRFNSSYDAAAGELVLKHFVHLGVAVDTERGLLVPVMREVQAKGILDIDAELSDLLQRARSGKLGPDDLAGATFTISNVGSIGGSHFTPLVTWPEVATLGVGRAETRPTREEDRLLDIATLPLSLSYDHRVIDGADAARFARWVADAIEDPMTMLLRH